MPTRLDPGINAHPIPAGVVLSTEEWQRLTAPLELGPDRTLEEVFHVLTGRVDASYNVAHVVRELLNAGEPSSSVPPTELPAAIRRIGEARHRAEQQARALAGEVADLTDRLERVLPDVFHAVIRDVAFDRGERQAELQWEDIEESAELALTLTLSLLTSYDVRDRDQARPVTPAEFYDATRDQARPVDTSAAARRFTVTLDGDPTTTFAPADPGSVANAEPVTLTPPADKRDYWTRGPGSEPVAWRDGGDARPQFLPPEVQALADETGWPYPDCDTCAAFVGMAYTDNFHASVRAHVHAEHPTVHTLADKITVTREAAWTDRAAVQLWGVTINPLHPFVLYLTEHLGPLKGCSGTPDCRRVLITNTLLDAVDDVRVATSTTGAPLEDWIRRSAELIADLTDSPHDLDSIGALSRLIRDASSYARRVIDRSQPCTICDGTGGEHGTHRLGCPNATTDTGTP